MADLIQNGIKWLAGRLFDTVSRTVEYHRGQDAVSLQAIIGRTVFEIVDSSGIVERYESRDFIVSADALVLAGEQIVPRRGDWIVETIGVAPLTYEVMAPENEPVWAYADAYHQMIRIHTKQIG